MQECIKLQGEMDSQNLDTGLYHYDATLYV